MKKLKYHEMRFATKILDIYRILLELRMMEYLLTGGHPLYFHYSYEQMLIVEYGLEKCQKT